jgi:replicative DNA helicase
MQKEFIKLPPQAIDVEVAVLGAIMLESQAFDLVSHYLNPNSFYVEKHKKIYKAFENLKKNNSPIDIITVVEELKKTNEIESVGGAYEVVKLTNAVISSANIETHAKIVCEKAIMRNLIQASSEIINAAYDEGTDVFELLQSAENSIKKLAIVQFRGE